MLKATDFCFLLHQETIPDPTLKKYLEIIFPSNELSAQSASMNLHSLTSSPLVYLNPYSTVPRTYLKICLTVAQYTLFGSTINLCEISKSKELEILLQ